MVGIGEASSQATPVKKGWKWASYCASPTKPNHHPIKTILAHRKHSTVKRQQLTFFSTAYKSSRIGMVWGSQVQQAYDVTERGTHGNECWKTSTAQGARIQISVPKRLSRKCGTNTEDSRKADRHRHLIPTCLYFQEKACAQVNDEVLQPSLQTYPSSH